MRKPVVAGQFYNAEKDGLLKEIEECFLSDFGVGKLPGKSRGKKRILGAIVPHAGYVFSGPCASHAYYEISKVGKVDLFLILGTNHHGMGKRVATSAIDWETPLGVCKIDKEFVRKIVEKGIAEVDEVAHAYEHSIEVQLPFIQFIQPDFKFCPIIFRDLNLDECIETAENFWEVLKDLRSFVILASSDFTHYGPMYGYLPFLSEVKENLYKLDREMIDLILNLEFEEFFKKVYGEGRTICGWLPITVLLILMKKFGAKGKLLKYYTSGDVVKDYSNAVGYASIVFER
ncbi:AmmeMemoRadiSam system protein B [Nanoarchaeota archaeon]|nr:MAG: AmmeMemoRadiSam system protein B [Nanoarchaeota archaeon]